MGTTHEGQGAVSARASEQAAMQGSEGGDGLLQALSALLDGVECRVAQGALPGAAERFVHFQVRLEQHLAQEERLLALLHEGAGADDAARRAAERGWNGQLRRVTGAIRVQLQLRDARGVAGQLCGLRELLADHRTNDVRCLWPLLQQRLPSQVLTDETPEGGASFAHTRSGSAACAPSRSG